MFTLVSTPHGGLATRVCELSARSCLAVSTPHGGLATTLISAEVSKPLFGFNSTRWISNSSSSWSEEQKRVVSTPHGGLATKKDYEDFLKLKEFQLHTVD